jgi:predicted small metal-binding protein
MRKIVDCREQPSETNCSLTLIGDEDEVVRAAAEHAVSVHGHTDGDELRSQIRAALRDEDADWTGTGFVQLIEVPTDRIDELSDLRQKWESEIGGDRTVIRSLLTTDRDQPGSVTVIVEFPSYEQATKNSEHPATNSFAKAVGEVVSGEQSFRNLDMVADRIADGAHLIER